MLWGNEHRKEKTLINYDCSQIKLPRISIEGILMVELPPSTAFPTAAAAVRTFPFSRVASSAAAEAAVAAWPACSARPMLQPVLLPLADPSSYTVTLVAAVSAVAGVAAMAAIARSTAPVRQLARAKAP